MSSIQCLYELPYWIGGRPKVVAMLLGSKQVNLSVLEILADIYIYIHTYTWHGSKPPVPATCCRIKGYPLSVFVFSGFSWGVSVHAIGSCFQARVN